MSSSSFPIDAGTVLVADASVVINLNATGCALEIIRSLPGALVVTGNAAVELAAGAHKGHNDHAQLQSLIKSGVIEIVALGDTGSQVYGSLIEGSAIRTLDDGEAATIAYAHEVGGIALIDEKKARAICSSDFPHLTIASTVELLMHKHVECSLGANVQSDAILNALRGARMRVLPDQIQAIVELIGQDAAASCQSLPKRARAS